MDCVAYNIQIWVGLRVGYTDIVRDMSDVRAICDEHVADGDCVTITPTEFRYKGGSEPGVIVGYINYPRFPRRKEQILDRAMRLAEKLRVGLNQNRVSITTPDRTYMIGE